MASIRFSLLYLGAIMAWSSIAVDNAKVAHRQIALYVLRQKLILQGCVECAILQLWIALAQQQLTVPQTTIIIMVFATSALWVVQHAPLEITALHVTADYSLWLIWQHRYVNVKMAISVLQTTPLIFYNVPHAILIVRLVTILVLIAQAAAHLISSTKTNA